MQAERMVGGCAVATPTHPMPVTQEDDVIVSGVSCPPRSHMPSIDRLEEFVAVVDAGSISGAARALGLPRATLSRRISALEAELEVRLIHRSTRRLVLTHAGEALARRARRVVREADEAWAAVRRLDDTPRGLLRVSDNGEWMDPLFVQFLARYPEVSLEVRVTTRRVDLVAEGVDVAIRFGEVRDPQLIVRKVWREVRVVVAAPAYLSRKNTPTCPAELMHHDCMVWFSEGTHSVREWPLLGGGTVPVGGRLVANSIHLMHSAALAGLGLVLLPKTLVSADLASGALVPVLEDSVGSDASASLVYVDRQYIQPKVRAFIDMAVPYLEQTLERSRSG